MADNESSPRESAILVASADGFSIFFRSVRRASASRMAAYCEIIAKIPVAAATPTARYLALSAAPSNIPNAASTKTPISNS